MSWIRDFLVLAGISIAVLLFSLSLSLFLFLHNAYGDTCYGVQHSSGMGACETASARAAIMEYLTSESYELPEGLNHREIAHLRDVRILVAGWRLIFAVSGIILAGLFAWLLAGKGWHEKLGLSFRQLRRGSLISVILILLASSFASKFGWLFDSFHRLFFAEGTWIFRSTDMLILLFPKEFFLDAFLRIMADSIIISLLLLCFSAFFMPE